MFQVLDGKADTDHQCVCVVGGACLTLHLSYEEDSVSTVSRVWQGDSAPGGNGCGPQTCVMESLSGVVTFIFRAWPFSSFCSETSERKGRALRAILGLPLGAARLRNTV